ncbi:MAG: di-heme oxidoredictase family protein [Pseudomonadota bacterium]
MSGVLFLLSLSSGALAVTLPATLEDFHLSILPRTEAEAARVEAILAPPTEFQQPHKFERMSAGAATVRPQRDEGAFSQPSGNLSFEDELDFRLGESLFEKLWVSSPSSTLASDGLGPLYNARACSRCHINDGRGHPPEGPSDPAVSMLLRIGVPAEPDGAMTGIAEYLSALPDPIYGRQIQDLSLPGHSAEARLEVSYDELQVPLSGGEHAVLRAPRYNAGDLGYGPLDPNARLSPRIAPQMIGLGLLEAVRSEDILALADPDDTDGDGISGRPNVVWSAEHNRPMLGRFGHKASQPTMREQVASAFANDIGISTSIFPDPWGECTSGQSTCRSAPNGDGDVRVFEVDDVALDLVTYYSRNLGVPMRRDVDDPEVLLGKKVFHEVGCASCHRPSFVTHRLSNQPEQSFQLIWPYTDLLLHDMGPGLADGLPEGAATGREWRTAPLWGIGMTEAVSGHTYFLHDGRARSLLEAVLWHGGEAEPQRDAVIAMPPERRQALLRFLESL